jgi:hypothetical protein
MADDQPAPDPTNLPSENSREFVDYVSAHFGFSRLDAALRAANQYSRPLNPIIATAIWELLQAAKSVSEAETIMRMRLNAFQSRLVNMWWLSPSVRCLNFE